jgi:hypothetical protein
MALRSMPKPEAGRTGRSASLLRQRGQRLRQIPAEVLPAQQVEKTRLFELAGDAPQDDHLRIRVRARKGPLEVLHCVEKNGPSTR